MPPKKKAKPIGQKREKTKTAKARPPKPQKNAKAQQTGPKTVRKLRLNRFQRKGQNGILTIIGGSRRYHGAPLYAIQAAAPFVDLIYFYSPEKDNAWIARKMKTKSRAFITVLNRIELNAAVEKSGAVLAGNGLGENPSNKKLVNGLLRKFPLKKFILDAGAMIVADKKLFRNRAVLTPHAGEFLRCFKKKASAEEAKKQASKNRCVILLKGKTDFITDGKGTFKNTTGNRGMTRGGTGDVLAGLVAALSTQNPLLLSAEAGAYLNGLAGDLVAKERKAFTADDVAARLPEAMETAHK